MLSTSPDDLTAEITALKAALDKMTTAYCEQSRREAEARARVCAEDGHDVPPVTARPAWWKDEPVRCRRCHGVIA